MDLHHRSMRENLLIMGAEENEEETYETSEALLRKFMQEQLGLTEEEAKRIQLERVHRLRQRKGPGKSRPLVVKFTTSKAKDQILSLSKKLKGTRFLGAKGDILRLLVLFEQQSQTPLKNLFYNYYMAKKYFCKAGYNTFLAFLFS